MTEREQTEIARGEGESPDEEQEQRRGARIRCAVWIGIEGVSSAPRLHRGDISLTGMFFEGSEMVGPVGSVQWLYLATLDRERAVQCLCRIIRIVSLDDIVHGQRLGIALEFMPESDEHRTAIRHLVQHVVATELRTDSGVVLDHRISVEGEREEEMVPATVKQLSIRRLLLETSWEPAIGDTIQVHLESKALGDRIPFSGEVVAVARSGSGDSYRVAVELVGRGGRRGRAPTGSELSLDDLSLEPLFSTMPLASPIGIAREHLVGQLDRIRLTSLLALFEMERMSGRLVLTGPGGHGKIYVADGRVVDVECDSAELPPRELLGQLLSWDQGAFEFHAQDVDLTDRLGMSTTGLLLELARVADERGRERN